MKKIAKLFSSEKNKARLFLALPFMLMDIFIRILSSDVYYIRPAIILPSLVFSAGWIILIVSLTEHIGKKAGKLFYGVFFLLFFAATFIQTVYYTHTKTFLSVTNSAHLKNAVLNVHPVIIALSIFLIGLTVFIYLRFPRNFCKFNFKKMLYPIIIFILIQFLNPFLLGTANQTHTWNTWRNPRNIYQNFNDYNKCIKVCGLYQYTFRDVVKSLESSETKQNSEEMTFLEEIHKEAIPHEKNDFTGIFENKNVIFLQLEGIDSWLLNPQDMPETYALLRNSINFTNHYSYYSDCGSTFNSEFAVTTGYLSPITYNKCAYELFTNSFPYSLPNRLKEKGYIVNAFHMNSGEYYCRRLNYKNWGYDNYFSLMDDEKQFGGKSKLDSELIFNKTFYNKMFCQDTPFMNYIITYTPHTPFSISSETGKALWKKENGNSSYPPLSEEAVARFFASETDNMVKLLIEALKENGLYENTIIVAFTDHYLYTLKDQSILEKYKNTDNNLINHTPFFIWGNDIAPVEINKVNSQLDILPTILNLLGINYNENDYIGNDIFDEEFSGYVFFNDYSWYDGNVYAEKGTHNTSMDEIINLKIKQNDLTLKNDYYR